MAQDLDEQLEKTTIEPSGITRKESEKKEQEEKLKVFCEENASRIMQWREANGLIRPPIFWNDAVQNFVWANRDQRRRLNKVARAAGRRTTKLILPQHLAEAGEDGARDIPLDTEENGTRNTQSDTGPDQEEQASGGRQNSAPKGESFGDVLGGVPETGGLEPST